MSPAAAKAQHSKATVEWGTPAHIVELARDVMGGIDCDPCSSFYWNAVVRATAFWNEEGRQGVASVDEKRWLINPPGGLVKEFWQSAINRWNEGSAVFWIGFSLNQMTYLGKRGLFAPQFIRCVPSQRLRYLTKVEGGPPVPGDAPPHGSYLALMPNSAEQAERFRVLAGAIGAVF